MSSKVKIRCVRHRRDSVERPTEGFTYRPFLHCSIAERCLHCRDKPLCVQGCCIEHRGRTYTQSNRTRCPKLKIIAQYLVPPLVNAVKPQVSHHHHQLDELSRYYHRHYATTTRNNATQHYPSFHTGWSTRNGTNTHGRPARRAAAVVPAPPCTTAHAHRGSSHVCGMDFTNITRFCGIP